MRYTTNKEINDLLCEYVALGWRVECGARHLHCYSPAGELVIVPRTPSDWRSVRNARALLRRKQRCVEKQSLG